MDGVYILDYSSGTPTIVGGFDLQGVVPNNGGSAIDLGTVNRNNVTGAISGDFDLSSDRGEPSVDLDAFGKVGQVGYGDIDLSDDGNTLWMVNLNQQALISVDVSGLSPNLANPNVLPATLVNQYPLSSFANLPSCSNGTLRPFALKIEDGDGYLGCVCDGASGTIADVDGYILSFDPTNPTNFTELTSFGFDYPREDIATGSSFARDGNWQVWMNTWDDAEVQQGFFDAAPQPIISDIEIKEDGSLIVGVMDRFSHQAGWEQFKALSGHRNTDINATAGGDILYFGKQGSTYIAELGENDPGGAHPGARTDDGLLGTGEFFHGDFYHGGGSTDVAHHETMLGGLALLDGTGEVVAVVYDPQDYNSQGIAWLSTATGGQVDAYEILGGTDNPANFGKGAALGDIELLCEVSPLEIGNYVWEDTDQDGLQDACEPGIPGVSVELYDAAGTTLIGVATTDMNGQYYFNATNVDENGVMPDGSATVGFTGLSPNTSYVVQITNAEGGSQQAALTGFELTAMDANGNNSDKIDNDASLDGTNATIMAATAEGGL